MKALFRSIGWIGRAMFLISAWGIAALIVMQVYLAGLAVLVRPDYWGTHTTLGHMFGPAIMALFVAGLVGRMPVRFTLYALGLFALYSLQYVFLHLPTDNMAFIRAFHPVNALMMLMFSVFVARSSGRIVGRSSTTMA